MAINKKTKRNLKHKATKMSLDQRLKPREKIIIKNKSRNRNRNRNKSKDRNKNNKDRSKHKIPTKLNFVERTSSSVHVHL